MRRFVRCVGVVAFGMTIANPVLAQELCRDNETVSACFNRVLVEAQDVQRAQQDETRTEIATIYNNTARNTNTGSLNSVAGLSSSVKDFLPLLNFTGVLGDISKDEQGGVVAVDLNLNVNDTDNNTQVRALIDTSQQLFEPIRGILPEANRDLREEELLEGADELNNVTLEVTYNVTAGGLGRSFAHHRMLLDRLVNQALEEVRSQTTDVLDADIALTRIEVGLGDINATMRNFPLLRELDAEPPEEVATRAEVEAAIRSGTNALIARGEAIEDAIEANGLDLFGQLVNNQPQLYVSVSRGFRDDLFGPDTWTGKITYEHSFVNLNAFRRRGAYTCGVSGDAAECLRAFSAYVSRNKARLKSGDRLAFSLEFSKSEPYEFMVPNVEEAISMSGGTDLAASLDYGRLIGVEDDGTASGRFDLAVSYQSPRSDLKNERFLASLTITQKFGDLSLPFGIAFANKTEYLSDFGNQLSAHVALKFDLFPGLD